MLLVDLSWILLQVSCHLYTAFVQQPEFPEEQSELPEVFLQLHKTVLVHGLVLSHTIGKLHGPITDLLLVWFHTTSEINTTGWQTNTSDVFSYLRGSCDLEDLHRASNNVLDRLLSDATEEHGGDLSQRSLRGHGLLTLGWGRVGGQVRLLLWRDPCHCWFGR